MEGLDVFGKVFTVLEIELLLAALLGRAGSCIGVFRRMAKNRSAKLLVNEDAGLLPAHAGVDRSLKAVINYLLDGGDLCCLIWA